MNAQAKKPLLHVYLAVGEDALKRRTVLERLRKRAAEYGDLDFNHDVFDGEKATGSEIAVACNTLPFASELRLVEVANAEKLAKQDSEVLCAYLAAPNASTVLALSAEKLAKNTRLYKAVAAVGKTAVIDCSSMKTYELVHAVRAMAVGHGFAMTDGAAKKLVELVGEDTIRIDSELRKLAAAHIGPDPANEREVESLVVRSTEAKPYELVNAFSARDARECRRLLSKMESTSPYSLVGMCARRLRELVCAKSLDARGEGSRLASTLGLRDWQVKNHLRWARGFTEEELRRAFSTLRDCERSMKSGADPDAAFHDWLFATISRAV